MAQSEVLAGYSNEVFEKLDRMRKDNILTDVVLTCHGKNFPAHRSHLSAASQYLYDMFNSGLMESSENNVDFPSMHPMSLEIILDLLYTGKLVPVKPCDLPDLVIALHLMQLDRGFNYYREVFLSLISKDNFKIYWDMGEILVDEKILNAVYNIIEDIYLLPDFKTIDNGRLEKLLAYLSMKFVSHDLILKVILQAALFKEDSQKFFDDTLIFIDFQKLSNDCLSTIDKNPLMKNSAAFHSQCHLVTLQRFQFVSSFSQYLRCAPLLYLFGRGENHQCMIQRCYMGEWENIILEDTIIPNYAVVGIQKNSIKFLIINEVVGTLQLTCIEFDMQGHKIGEKIIKDESVNDIFNDREVTNRLQSAGFTIEKLKKNSDADSVECQPEEEDTLKLRKCYLIQCENDLLSIDQVEKEEGKMTLEIYESRNQLPAGPWNLRLSVDWTNLTTNWFAYFLPPSFIVIRSFPGLSLYYDLSPTASNVHEFKKDNNNLEDVVSLVKSNWNVCCLTADGSIYFQDVRESSSEWKFLIKCPFVVAEYYQIILSDGGILPPCKILS